MDQDIEQFDKELNILNVKMALIGCHKIDCSECKQFIFNSMDMPICKLNPHNGLYFKPIGK